MKNSSLRLRGERFFVSLVYRAPYTIKSGGIIIIMTKHLFGLVFVPFAVFCLAPPQQASGMNKKGEKHEKFLNISQKTFSSSRSER